MKQIELTNRLSAVADLVPRGARLCDVGTDHAYLPTALLLRGEILRAVVTDLRPGPLEHARRTAAKYNVTDRMDFRLCDGLTGVGAGECDAVTIAGMGGETIAHILSDAPWVREGKALILQPQSTHPVLRRFLQRSGYRIRSERVAREGGRWYTVMEVSGGEMAPLTPGQEAAGRREDWIDQPERRGYLAWLCAGLRRQCEGLGRSAKPEDALRLAWMRRALEELEPIVRHPE
ncbi:MAG: SAM-dependent methyltransferase [Oscillospiraceae bacterium]|nr:SAM-dependent methyltransferase [Oscillospiraceae bacterium]